VRNAGDERRQRNQAQGCKGKTRFATSMGLSEEVIFLSKTFAIARHAIDKIAGTSRSILFFTTT